MASRVRGDYAMMKTLQTYIVQSTPTLSHGDNLDTRLRAIRDLQPQEFSRWYPQLVEAERAVPRLIEQFAPIRVERDIKIRYFSAEAEVDEKIRPGMVQLKQDRTTS